MKPNTVDICDLSTILHGVDRALSDSEGEDIRHTRGHKVSVSLTDIKIGSACLLFETPDYYYVKKWSNIASAIRDENFIGLGSRCRQALEDIRRILSSLRARATFKIIAENGEETDLASLSPTASILEDADFIKGETEVIGKIYDVGGKKPNVHVEFLGQSKLVRCALPKGGLVETARKIGSRVYGLFKLRGIATWDSKTGDIQAFSIIEAKELDETPPDKAFESLREAFGDIFDGINDPDDFIRDLREDA